MPEVKEKIYTIDDDIPVAIYPGFNLKINN